MDDMTKSFENFVVAVGIVVTAVTCTASETIRLHRSRDGAAVVTLADPDRSDPYEFRYVLVSGSGDWSVLVDRDTGRVKLCAEKPGPGTPSDSQGLPQMKYEDCVVIHAGVVVQ